MITEEKRIILKNGKEAVFKTAEISDAEKMLSYIRQASGETDFLVRYPEEWTSSVSDEERWIKNFRESENVVNITCFIDGEIAGNCEICFRTGIKNSHLAGIGIAILRDYWNLGIGSLMFTFMIEEAKKRDTEIMELSCFSGNKRAQHLYEKFGFRTAAVKPNVYKLKDGSYQNEVYMQKIL